MHKRSYLVAAVCAALSLAAGPGRADSLPGHMGRDSLIEPEQLPRFSLGASAETIQRDITIDNHGTGKLDGSAYSAYFGIDAWRWITVFGTAGATELNGLGIPGTVESYSGAFRWSAGLNASIWHMDMVGAHEPWGRLSVGATFEYTDASASRDGAKASWTDTAIALPVGFEIPNDPMWFYGVYSMYVYAGPAYSAIHGSYDGPAPSFDFKQSKDMGVLAGMDLYIAPHASIGGSLLYFDQMAGALTARYHF